MIAWFLAAGLAHAIQVSGRDIACPVGSGTARVYTRVTNNASGGYDSDLASYSAGGQWRAYRIATCKPSQLTLFGADMDAGVPTARQAAVTAATQKAVAALPNPADPTLWERYGLAVAAYEALGKDDVFLGDLWVEASWTARDAAVGYYENLQGPKAARALVDAGRTELAKPLSAADRKKVLYNLARVAHRGGFNDERDAFLKQFEAAGALEPRETKALATFRTIVRDVEPALQDRAIARYTTALRTQLAHDEKVRVTYVLADLLRRRGRAREALPLYFLVANDSQAREDLRAMALFLADGLAARLNPGTTPTPAAPKPAK